MGNFDIRVANETSREAHRVMMYALFNATFNVSEQIVTSEELLEIGFDDSKEPDITDYYDYF